MTQVNGIKSGETKQTLELKAKQEIAWKSGVDLFSNLAGITSKEEQKAVVDIVKNADVANIGYLLKGYNRSEFMQAGILEGGAGGFLLGNLIYIGRPTVALGAGAIGAVGGAIIMGAKDADPIFEQINSEYSFPQKQEVMMDLAKKCHEYLKTLEKPDEKSVYGAVHLEQIIQKGKIDKQDIKHLDNIAKIITDKIK